MKKGKISKFRYFMVIVSLASVGFMFQIFEFPVPGVLPAYLKMDISDFSELLGSFAMGPVAGVCIVVLRNLMHVSLSQTAGIGEVSNGLAGLTFAIPAGLIYKYNRTKRGMVIAALTASVVMTICSFPLNKFIIYPMYETIIPKEHFMLVFQEILPWVKNLDQCLVIFCMPLSLVKGLCSSVIALLVYKKVYPFMQGDG